MDMDMGGMSMGDMSAGNGIATPYTIEKTYWAFVGAAIAAATAVNVLDKAICWHRLRAAEKGTLTPARVRSMRMAPIATTTALCREITYATFQSHALKEIGIRLPTLGSFLLAIAQLILVLVLCFYEMNPEDSSQWENVAYRIGYLATAQLPLIYMLSGKVNIVGFLTGVGYEKLNWIHRWTARVLFLTVTVHMILWFRDWARYDYITTKLMTDKITQRGFAAWVILLWIVLSSTRPVRGLSHEVFVIQHLVTMAGFSAAVYLHLPSDIKYVLWISVAFAVFDRAARLLIVLVQNLHFSAKRGHRALGYDARLEKLPGGVTRITIPAPNFSWRPGQHVFMACHGIAPLQSHPFTIASLPSDGRLTFIVKAQRGGTRRIHDRAGEELPLIERSRREETSFATVEGPYGRIRPLQQFDSVVFLAGSTGVTFTLPLMRDLVRRCTGESSSSSDGGKSCVTTSIRFVWVVKSQSHLAWIADELNAAMNVVQASRRGGCDIELSVSVYVTCDENLDNDGDVRGVVVQRSMPASGTATQVAEKTIATATVVEMDSSTRLRKAGGRKSCGPNGTCCCTAVVDESDGEELGIRECHCNCGQPDDEEDSDEKEASRKDYSGSSSELSTAAESMTAAGNAGAGAGNVGGGVALHPSVSLLSGRPAVRGLLRRSLERARGESAVVACGPAGLVQDVRASVVRLSDERAVHKGTGAQGIYLHGEEFCF